jgi:hypothetical protein
MFNPLGNFKPNAAIVPGILDKAKSFYAKLPECTSGGLRYIYLHWTVGSMGECFDDYNVETPYANGDYYFAMTHSPLDNDATGSMQNYAAHTFHRNTGGIGVAITGMDGATVNNFGDDGVTVTGLTYLCAAAAVVAAKYGIDVAGTKADGFYAGEHTVLTHAEAADLVGNPPQYEPYGPLNGATRWDLCSFVAVPEGESLPPAHVCGDALRSLIHSYKEALLA